MGSAHVTPVADQDPEEPQLAVWRSPCWPRGSFSFPTGPGLVAGCSYAQGELVESSYCLELRPGELSKSYLDGYCLEVPLPLEIRNDTGRPSRGEAARLLPLCWGLVLLSGVDQEAPGSIVPNLMTDVVWEPPTPPPGDREAATASSTSKPCAWLRFWATRPIALGEALCAALGPNIRQRVRGSVFEAARRFYGMDNWWHAPPDRENENSICIVHFDESGEAPRDVVLPADPAVVVAASGVHGVGMYATRDLVPGDFLEIAPLLPVSDDHFTGDDVVHNYTFANEFGQEGLGVVSILQLGGGCIYNHSDDHTVADHTFEDSPFLRKWYAVDKIPRGTEALSSYGDDYWSSRGVKPRPPRPTNKSVLFCG